MLRSVLLLPLVLAIHSCWPQPLSETVDLCEAHPLHAGFAAGEHAALRVIVTLNPEHGDDVRMLQDRLLKALEGTDHELLRRMDSFPVLTLRVGEDAFCQLVVSPLVQAVEEDRAEPTN